MKNKLKLFILGGLICSLVLWISFSHNIIDQDSVLEPESVFLENNENNNEVDKITDNSDIIVDNSFVLENTDNNIADEIDNTRADDEITTDEGDLSNNDGLIDEIDQTNSDILGDEGDSPSNNSTDNTANNTTENLTDNSTDSAASNTTDNTTDNAIDNTAIDLADTTTTNGYNQDNPLMGIQLGVLEPSRIVLTTGVNPAYSVGITFNLDMLSEDVEVMVLDSQKNLVNVYGVTDNTIDILDGEFRPLYVYKTFMSNLNSNSLYYYVIKSEDSYSDLYSFRTLVSGGEITFGFFGDPQGYKQSQYDNLSNIYSMANNMASGIDVSYIAGDIVDSRGSAESWDQWEYFDNAMKAYTQSSIFVTAIGNHDAGGAEPIYANTFNYPENGVTGLSERNFYFDLPYARVAVWDTESTSTFEAQSEWLNSIMASSSKPFKIVLMHRSVYPMLYNESHIRALAATFENAGIDLVLNGHDHIYSRTTMLNGEMLPEDSAGNLDSSGVTYITGGSSSGSKYYNTDDSVDRYWKDFVYDTNHPVFTILKIGKDTITINAYAVSNGVSELIDSVSLTN